MCVKSGFDHLLTVDLHSKESQGFFGCRMDNLRAAPFFLQYVIENIPDYQNAVIVARNPLGARRATSFADRLKVNIAVLHGEYKDEADERDDDDGRASPPPLGTLCHPLVLCHTSWPPPLVSSPPQGRTSPPPKGTLCYQHSSSPQG